MCYWGSLVAITATAPTVAATVAAATASAVTTTIAATVSAAATASAVTATVSTAATATAVTTTAAESTAITFRARAGFVHYQVTTLEVLSVRAFNALTTGIVIGHLHETESTAAVGGLVHDDLGRGYFTVGFEELAEVLVPYTVGDVGDVNVHVFY